MICQINFARSVGPALAIGMLSALSATRLIRAIREEDFRHFTAFHVSDERRPSVADADWGVGAAFDAGASGRSAAELIEQR
jgi:hypothetical protein